MIDFVMMLGAGMALAAAAMAVGCFVSLLLHAEERRAFVGWLVWLVLRAYAATRPVRFLGRRDSSEWPPLITRWFLTSSPVGDETGTPGWYLHRLHIPDPARSQHCHPWEDAEMWVLRGGYVEERGDQRNLYTPGAHARLDAGTYHRIASVMPNTWTLFRAGPKHGRGWGFRP